MGGIPQAPAMQQEKPLALGSVAVRTIQARNARSCKAQQLLVIRGSFGGGVAPIGEQCEANVAVLRSKVVNLQAVHELLDVGAAGQQHGHCDHGAQLRVHPALELQARQHMGTAEMRHP